MGSFTRVLIMSGAVALAAPAVQAQEVAGNFDQLRVVLKSGEAVRVTDSSGQQIRGQFLDLSPTSLSILSKGVRREIAASDVDVITAGRHGNLATGAKWGLGVGAGFGGLVALMSVGGRCYGECAGFVIGASLINAGVGAGIGVGVSALTTHQQVIFAKSTEHPVKISVAPAIGRDSKGVMFNVRW